jgi:hypothetical protein
MQTSQKLHASCSKRQHVPLETYCELLRATVQQVRACGAGAMVIITPPPVDEPARIDSRKQAGDPLQVAAFKRGSCSGQ